MVKIHYTLKDSDGTLIDSSSGLAPFEYLHGNGNLIPGLEAELEGKNPGDTFTVTVLPKDGYGEYDPKLHIEVPRDQFDNGSPLEVGMKFQAQTAGGPIELPPKEFDLLLLLARNQGRVLTKQRIYEEVWGEPYAYDDSTIMAIVSRLRKKIEPDQSHPSYIQTVRGGGYRFSGEA